MAASRCTRRLRCSKRLENALFLLVRAVLTRKGKMPAPFPWRSNNRFESHDAKNFRQQSKLLWLYLTVKLLFKGCCSRFLLAYINTKFHFRSLLNGLDQKVGYTSQKKRCLDSLTGSSLKCNRSHFSTLPAKIDLNKKWLPKQKTIQNFTIDAQGFRKTRNENPPTQEIGVIS